MDFSVVWVEGNYKAGVRFIDGPRNIALRQVYTFQSAPRVPPTFEGDIVLGRSGGTAAENSYSGITIDGIFQNFLYGPAVRLFQATGAAIRDVRVRNIFVGVPFNPSLYEGKLFGGGSGSDAGSGPPPPPGVVVPIAEAIVQLDDGTYDGLVVESVQPFAGTAGLPENTNGEIVQLINRPDLVDRIVFSGPYDATFSYGTYEMQGPTVARRGLTHTSSYAIRQNDPMYHRVKAASGVTTITLPRITRVSETMPIERVGLGFHIMWVGGIGPLVQVLGATVPFTGGSYVAQIVGLPNPAGANSLRFNTQYAYVRVRAIAEGTGNPFWEIVDFADIAL